jgi:hypothetical protein
MVPIFLIGAFLIYQRVAYESTDFFKENFIAYPIPLALAENQEIAPSLYAMEAGDYSIAVEELSHRFDETKDPNIGMQLGMALVGSEDYWAAITVFDEVKRIEPALLAETEWYKILSLIALEEKDEAKDMLDYYCEQVDFKFNREKALELKANY